VADAPADAPDERPSSIQLEKGRRRSEQAVSR
jgi:hypothetical protein